MEPDTAGRAGDEDDVTGDDLERVEDVERRAAGEPDRRGLLTRHAVGDARERRCGLDDVLADAAAPERAVDRPRHAVADGEPVNAGADRLDDTREVAADHDRELRLHRVPDPTADDGKIESVDRCRLDRDPHLTRPGFKIGNLNDLRGSAALSDSKSLHV